MEEIDTDLEAQVLLTDIRMDGVGFSIAALREPFCMSGVTGPVSLCYVVGKRPIWLEVERGNRTTSLLEPGSVVGLSGVVPHWFKSAPRLSTLDARPLICSPLGAATRSGAIELLIGHAPIETLAFTNTVSGAVVIPPNAGRIARRIRRAVDGIEDELRDPDPTGGASAVVRRLSETILMNIARWVIAEAPDQGVALAAMGDARVMRAIAATARAPLKPWTIGSMAKVAGMSRTAFARQFRALTGDTPLRMLTHLRLRMAADVLMRGNRNIEEAAAAAGYSSAAAFIRAFQKSYHATPAQWREARARPRT